MPSALREDGIAVHSHAGALWSEPWTLATDAGQSIRVHPDQETLKTMMERAGLEKVDYFNLALGVVALHRGFKF